MDFNRDNVTPYEIFRIILDQIKNPVEYQYLIFGKCGRTGKTWLCERLKHCHLDAVELSELINPLVDYPTKKNHYVIDHDKKLMIIILNEKVDV